MIERVCWLALDLCCEDRFGAALSAERVVDEDLLEALLAELDLALELEDTVTVLQPRAVSGPPLVSRTLKHTFRSPGAAAMRV